MQYHLFIELFVLFIIKCDAVTVKGPNLAGKCEAKKRMTHNVRFPFQIFAVFANNVPNCSEIFVL